MKDASGGLEMLSADDRTGFALFGMDGQGEDVDSVFQLHKMVAVGSIKYGEAFGIINDFVGALSVKSAGAMCWCDCSPNVRLA